MGHASILAFVLAFSAPTANLAPRPSDSLEELLERARRESAEAQKRIQSTLDALLAELEASPDPRDLPAKVDRAVELGPEATPLLVRYVDPGEAPVDGKRLRAQQIAIALSRMDTSAITTALLDLLSSGSAEGKRNALRVLQTNPEVTRVGPAVERLFRASEGALRTNALRTLIAMGGGASAGLLNEILSGSDDELIALALGGLAEQKHAESVEQVRNLLSTPKTAARHAKPLLAYFCAVPEVASSSDIGHFLKLAQSAAIALDTRVAVVNGLASLNPTLNGEFRRGMEGIVGSADRRLRESGLVLLARMGDRAARRDLIKPYDEVVSKNDRWFDAYGQRADIYARIGDDDEAIKDYRQALSVGRDDNVPAELHEKLARAYARKGKFKDSSDVLARAPLSAARLRQLAEDPDFAAMRASKYGKEIFGAK